MKHLEAPYIENISIMYKAISFMYYSVKVGFHQTGDLFIKLLNSLIAQLCYLFRI